MKSLIYKSGSFVVSFLFFALFFIAPPKVSALYSISASMSCSALTVTNLPAAGREYAVWIVGVNYADGNIAVSNANRVTTNNLVNYKKLTTNSLQGGSQFVVRVVDQATGERIGIAPITIPTGCNNLPQVQDVLNISQTIDCSAIRVSGLLANHSYHVFVNGKSNFYEKDFTTDTSGSFLNYFDTGSWPGYLPQGSFAWLEVHDNSDYYNTYGVNVVQSAGYCPIPGEPVMAGATFVANPTSGGYPGIQVSWADKSNNETAFELRGNYTDGTSSTYSFGPNITSLFDNARSSVRTCSGANGTTYQVRSAVQRMYGVTYSQWSGIYTTICLPTPAPVTPPPSTPRPSASPVATVAPGPICTTSKTDIVFLMDASRSMDSQSRLVQAKAAAKNIAGKLYTDNDVRIALVKFGSSGSTSKVLGFTSASNKSNLYSKIDGLTTTTDTYMGKGLDITNSLFKNDSRSDAKRYIILLSDGRADDKSKVQSVLPTSVSLGIKIYTVGVGNTADLDETLMKQIASTTGGQYYYVKDANLLTSIYNNIAVIICPSLKLSETGISIAQSPINVRNVVPAKNLLERFVSWFMHTLQGVKEPSDSYAAQ